MGKLRQWIDKVWDRIGGDALWHVITEVKRYFLGPWGVWHVLTFIAGGITSGYYAFQAYMNSWPSYFIVPFFIVLFACVVGILNGVWSLWNKWQYRHFTIQSAASSTLGPDELIHPPSNGVLWRWNPEIAADGPFCPTHPQERLFLKGKHGGQKWKDFEADYVNHHQFTCPINQSEDFKFLESPEQIPLRIYQLRAQATARFRAMQQNLTTTSENDEDTKGIFEIKQVHSEILWRGIAGGEYHPLSNEDRIPHNADFFLQITVQIIAKPPRFVEEIELEFPGKRINDSNWIPERISGQREAYTRFKFPSSMGQGKYSAQLIVKALGVNKGVIERRSRSFDAVIAHSYSDFQKYSGISQQKIVDLESKSEETSGQTETKITCEVYGIPLGLLVEGQLLLFVPEVTIVNHSHTKTASIKVELLVPIGGHGMACLLPKSSPIKEWEQASQYAGNRCLSFPLNLPAGNADGGYIAFGTETLKRFCPTTNAPNFKNCEVQFTDLHSGQTIYSKSLRFIINL